MITPVEITQVCQQKGDEIRGFIDLPKPHSTYQAHSLPVVGWAIGTSVPVAAVEVEYEGEVLKHVPVQTARPDVAAAFPDFPEAATPGFSSTIGFFAPKLELIFRLRAVLHNQRRIPLGSFRGRESRQAPISRQPLVSVVITCFNQAHYLDEAIESVLAQSYRCFELLIVDDGSVDNTEKVTAVYPGIRYIRQKNQGLAASRNAGLYATNGDHIVFLDADDRLLPHALEAGVGALRQRPECGLVSGHHRLITEGGEFISSCDDLCQAGEGFPALLRRNYIAMHGTVMYRREAVECIDGFNPRLDACEDYEVFLGVAKRFPIYCHHQQVAEYRTHAANMSKDGALMLRSMMKVLRAHSKNVGRSTELRAAYRAGRAFARSYYGGQLIGEVVSDLEQRRWRKSFSKGAVLLRHHPRGVLPLVATMANQRNEKH